MTTTSRLPLRFVRHGATLANLAGLRCGGDLDLPLTDEGRRQAEAAARQLARMDPPIGCIITSDLRRTRETAEIIAAALPGCRVLSEPGFAERRLGAWNLRPVLETQAALANHETPPGGESEAAFLHRIDLAMRRIDEHFLNSPLLVSSKGVARALGKLMKLPVPPDLGNGVVAEFDLADQTCYPIEWSTL